MKSWIQVQLISLFLNQFNFEGWNQEKNTNKKTCKNRKITKKKIRIKIDRKKLKDNEI
jgi:hypothetical protein